MTREDIEEAWLLVSHKDPARFALDMVRKHNDECAEIVNAARYEQVDLRSLVSRISGLKP